MGRPKRRSGAPTTHARGRAQPVSTPPGTRDLRPLASGAGGTAREGEGSSEGLQADRFPPRAPRLARSRRTPACPPTTSERLRPRPRRLRGPSRLRGGPASRWASPRRRVPLAQASSRVRRRPGAEAGLGLIPGQILCESSCNILFPTVFPLNI